MSRTGDWIATFSGTQWFITDPDPADVRIDDVAHGLSLICRYGGHCKAFYSVAEHSVRMALEAKRRGHSKEVMLWALLHDSPEAYLGDVVRPLKRSLPFYKDVEGLTATVILAGLQVPWPGEEVFRLVKELDDVLLMTERRDLVNHCGHEWTQRAEPLPGRIYPMTARTAESSFLGLYREIRGERQQPYSVDWQQTGCDTVKAMREALERGQGVELTPHQIFSIIGYMKDGRESL